jgi:hypothetical protein
MRYHHKGAVSDSAQTNRNPYTGGAATIGGAHTTLSTLRPAGRRAHFTEWYLSVPVAGVPVCRHEPWTQFDRRRMVTGGDG